MSPVEGIAGFIVGHAGNGWGRDLSLKVPPDFGEMSASFRGGSN